MVRTVCNGAFLLRWIALEFAGPYLLHQSPPQSPTVTTKATTPHHTTPHPTPPPPKNTTVAPITTRPQPVTTTIRPTPPPPSGYQYAPDCMAFYDQNSNDTFVDTFGAVCSSILTYTCCDPLCELINCDAAS